MRHSRIKYCKSNESISFEKMIFSPRGKCAFFALKIISIFLILLLTFISWTLLFRFQYIDQDEGWNKIADAFDKVGYIKDWKKNTNKYVCGYLDDKYYSLQTQKAQHIM
ncbi:hypothetical protein, partial [Helicobacter typhlonius]|uniref:hypothetical protein n=1 Tax=Helicobacter typhlonius TaxID=76936 RepID=UPI002FE07170